jgi:hypothetical protein
MKQIIKNVLDDMSESQINLGSETARKTISSLISAALKTKGCYTEYDDSEIEEQNARATWVCSICGENTADVDYDYLGSGTNHLGCELKSQEEIDKYVEDIDEQAHAQGRESSHRVVDDAGVDIETGKYVGGGIQGSEEIDGAYTAEEFEEWEEAVKKEPELKFDFITEELYTDEPYEGLPEGLKRAKELSQEALKGGLQKQAYMEMTSDGLPEGGDAQAVLESHKLADEIVDNKDEKWIYESPDGGKTVFRRPFSDYDPKNKEEIDWETKEPTGRKFTEYNNGNWRSKDEG